MNLGVFLYEAIKIYMVFKNLFKDSVIYEILKLFFLNELHWLRT